MCAVWQQKNTGGRRRAPGPCRPLRFGKGRAYYLASRFEAPFYDGLYQAAAHEAGLTSCRPAALPEGVLAVRRGELLFLQNCRSMPVLLPSDCELPGYGTAVYRAGGERLL